MCRLTIPAVLALLTVACGSPRRQCTPESGCPEGQACSDGVCVPNGVEVPPDEACPPSGKNLLRNAGFECGDPPAGWFAQNGELIVDTARPRSGARAARLTAKVGTIAHLWYQADAVTAPGTSTYCARAWLRGTARDGRLTIRRVTSASGGIDETFSSPVTADWTQVPPYNPLKFTSANDQKLLLKVWIPDAAPGLELYVDDVELWRSPDGTCQER